MIVSRIKEHLLQRVHNDRPIYEGCLDHYRCMSVWLCAKDIAVVRPAIAQGTLQRVTIVAIELPDWYYGPVGVAPRRNYVLPVWQTK